MDPEISQVGYYLPYVLVRQRSSRWDAEMHRQRSGIILGSRVALGHGCWFAETSGR